MRPRSNVSRVLRFEALAIALTILVTILLTGIDWLSTRMILPSQVVARLIVFIAFWNIMLLLWAAFIRMMKRWEHRSR